MACISYVFYFKRNFELFYIVKFFPYTLWHIINDIKCQSIYSNITSLHSIVCTVVCACRLTLCVCVCVCVCVCERERERERERESEDEMREQESRGEERRGEKRRGEEGAG